MKTILINSSTFLKGHYPKARGWGGNYFLLDERQNTITMKSKEFWATKVPRFPVVLHEPKGGITLYQAVLENGVWSVTYQNVNNTRRAKSILKWHNECGYPVPTFKIEDDGYLFTLIFPDPKLSNYEEFYTAKGMTVQLRQLLNKLDELDGVEAGHQTSPMGQMSIDFIGHEDGYSNVVNTDDLESLTEVFNTAYTFYAKAITFKG